MASFPLFSLRFSPSPFPFPQLRVSLPFRKPSHLTQFLDFYTSRRFYGNTHIPFRFNFPYRSEAFTSYPIPRFRRFSLLFSPSTVPRSFVFRCRSETPTSYPIPRFRLKPPLILLFFCRFNLVIFMPIWRRLFVSSALARVLGAGSRRCWAGMLLRI